MAHEVFQYDRQTLPRSLSAYPFDDSYRSPLMLHAPQLDGIVRAEDWKLATGFDGLSYISVLDERRMHAYVGATRTHLYFALVSELPPGLGPVTDVAVHTDKLVWDDAVEVWIDPEPGAENGVAYQMLVNANGIDAYLTHPRGNLKPEQFYGWKGNYRIANAIHDGFWHCQIEVAIASIAPHRDATQGRWGMNICRDYKRPWGFASLGNRSYTPKGEIVFSFHEQGAAAIQMRHRSDPVSRRISTVLSVFNPGVSSMELSAQLFLKRDKMPEATASERFGLAPGENREMMLELEDGVSDLFEMFALVRDSNDVVQHSRYYKWGPARGFRWDTHKIERLPVDFSFAYYPYANRLRIKADVSGLAGDAMLEVIDFVIRKKGEAKVIRSVRFEEKEFEGKICEKSIELPPLDGEYEISAQSRGRGVPNEPVVKTFQRTVYKWEHQKLGMSRKVYAPFTPIEVQGRTLKTAMKEYELGDCGLLDQVRTDDQQRLGMKPILAGAMRYVARVGGEVFSARSQMFRISSSEEDRVIAEGRCAAGALPMEWKSTLEYDGMLRVDLTLLPTGVKRVEKLDLEIPIDASVAQMLHAMADGIRYPIRTMRLPEGQGVVWDSGKLLTSDYPPNFATYVFLGDAARGICWFAENDRGWSWDSGTPNLEIVRDAEKVTLIVHLVNVPIAIDSPRTLTFGLQASPVKPYSSGWRRRWEMEQFSVIGTDIHWFGLGCCASVYPANKDLSLWETLRKSTREPLKDIEIEQTIARAREHFLIRGEKIASYMESVARKNLRTRLGKKIIFYYNRSATPATDEFQTFMDEWCVNDFNSMRGSTAQHEIKIIPADSYIDFALHWYVKSFEHSPNTGVYVDNIFFCPSKNLEMTGAYRRPGGSVMPSTGLWELRELAKRTFVMLNERGMEPHHMVHLTSAMILPIMSFYTIQYDWEWHFSEGDVQDRFQREYLLLVSSGAHLGAWPIVLHDQGRSVADEWTLRTFLAVSIVHDLIVDPYVWDVGVIPTGDTPENRMFAALRQPILDICGHSDVEAWRYWDERPQPVNTGDPMLPAIVFSRWGKESIIAITSYLDHDTTAEITIDPRPLGLSGGFVAIDLETGKRVDVENNLLRLHINRHDIREFKLLPR